MRRTGNRQGGERAKKGRGEGAGGAPVDTALPRVTLNRKAGALMTTRGGSRRSCTQAGKQADTYTNCLITT